MIILASSSAGIRNIFFPVYAGKKSGVLRIVHSLHSDQNPSSVIRGSRDAAGTEFLNGAVMARVFVLAWPYARCVAKFLGKKKDGTGFTGSVLEMAGA